MRGLALLLLLLASTAGCRSAPRSTPPVPIDCWVLLSIAEGDDSEARYHAILALRRCDTPAVRARLRTLVEQDDILTQNAAARVLVEFGETGYTTVLIDNLDRRNRTWAVTDAIHHLVALYGATRGYEPNKGYRTQADAQRMWWGWWTDQDFLGVRGPYDRKPTEEEAAYEARFMELGPKIEAYLASNADDKTTAWTETVALWRELAELQKSRDPQHVALVAKAFAEMTKRWPTDPALANNHALSALNNGEFAAAEASYRRLLELSPDEAYFHNDYGILLEGLGRLEEAGAQYAEAIRLDPSDSTWWSNHGDVLRKLGRQAEAIAAYRESEQRAPEKWYYHRLWIKRLSATR